MIWLTEIYEVDPDTDELIIKEGPRIEADSYNEACKIAELIDCRVVGRLILEIEQIWEN